MSRKRRIAISFAAGLGIASASLFLSESLPIVKFLLAPGFAVLRLMDYNINIFTPQGMIELLAVCILPSAIVLAGLVLAIWTLCLELNK